MSMIQADSLVELSVRKQKCLLTYAQAKAEIPRKLAETLGQSFILDDLVCRTWDTGAHYYYPASGMGCVVATIRSV